MPGLQPHRAPSWLPAFRPPGQGNRCWRRAPAPSLRKGGFSTVEEQAGSRALNRRGNRVVAAQAEPQGPQGAGAGGGVEAGAFSRAVQALSNRLIAAVEAERQEQMEQQSRLYSRSSLHRLREEGLVLTHLAAEEEDRLYSDFVWKLYLHPQYALSAAGSATGGRAVPGGLSELPYHKFQRGDSCLITWEFGVVAGGAAAQPGQLRGGAAQGGGKGGGEKRQQEQQQQGLGPESRRGGESASGGGGGAGGGGAEEWESLDGAVLEVKRTHLLLALSKNASSRLEELTEGGALLRLDKGTNDVTSQRQLEALRQLETFKNPNNMGEQLVRAVILGADARCAAQRPAWAMSDLPGSWYRDAQRMLHDLPQLNWSQKAAIATSVSSSFSLWQGPPGTGKTRTLLGFMQVLCATNRKRGGAAWHEMGPILAAADTNAACDNMVAGLLERGVRVVRLGQPAKVRPELWRACLDAQVEATASGKRAVQLREQAAALLKRARTGRLDGSLSREEVALLRRDADRCWEQAEEIIKLTEQRLLGTAEVVAATCTRCGEPRLREMVFRVVVVDEASQATEPSTLIPLIKGAECVVMAGDINQLPPTVISRNALEYRLDTPLLARLQAGGMPARLLELQYRMHPDIATFSSRHFYGGRVKSAVDAADRPLIKGVPWQAGCPVMFLHCEHQERRAATGVAQAAAEGGTAGNRAEGGSSYLNEGEARLAMRVLHDVLVANPSLESVALLTPYNGQVRLLTKLLRELNCTHLAPGVSVTVSSVDGYQGREADLVIFSTVRSNPEGRLGFVTDKRRLNVAITRARRGLVVLGNGNTLRHDPNWQAWLTWVIERTARPPPHQSPPAPPPPPQQMAQPLTQQQQPPGQLHGASPATATLPGPAHVEKGVA